MLNKILAFAGAYFVVFHIIFSRGIALQWSDADPTWMRALAPILRFLAPIWFPIAWLFGDGKIDPPDDLPY